MAKLTKKQKALQGKVETTKLYPFAEAVALVKEAATAKFDESIDVAVQLGVDAKKSDQVVRGAVVLPHGTGKTTRVAVFAQGAKAEEAKRQLSARLHSDRCLGEATLELIAEVSRLNNGGSEQVTDASIAQHIDQLQPLAKSYGYRIVKPSMLAQVVKL